MTIKEAQETGSKLPSQFQLGEAVDCCLDSFLDDGNNWVQGWIVGIKYSSSKVFYDVAVRVKNSDTCFVIEHLRCFMVSLVNENNKTNFVNRNAIQTPRKDTLN